MDLIWTVSHPSFTGTERCTLQQTTQGWVVAGSVVASDEGRPLDVQYEVVVDAAWATRSVEVTMDRMAEPQRLRLDRSATGTWTIDGNAAPQLDGCIDVDLGVTPSTNTLPIRRLGLDVGDHADVDVAWVKFPGLNVERGRQRYTRLAQEVWRYSSDTFTADLTIDSNGLVVRYGTDLWRRVLPDGR